MEMDLMYSDVTRKIIGAGMKVHRELGPGFSELIYKRAIIVEMRHDGLICDFELMRDVYYNGELVGKKRLDLVVCDKVLVELKAASEITNANCCQIINYLKVFGIEVGLLLNFGNETFGFKRFINSRSK